MKHLRYGQDGSNAWQSNFYDVFISYRKGWRDALVAPASIVEYARQYATRLHLLPGDHRLGGVLPEVGELFRRFLDRVISEGDQSVGQGAQSHD